MAEFFPRWRRLAKAEKNRMRKAQRNKCAICGKSFGAANPTFEHVVPRKHGGHHRGNLVLSHPECNHDRGPAKPTGCLLIMLAAVNARLRK